MSLNELLYDNVNLDVSQSCAFECDLILKHPLQELDRLYRTKLLDHSFDNFGVSNATIYVSYCHEYLPYTLAPFHARLSCVPRRDERTWSYPTAGAVRATFVDSADAKSSGKL